MPYALSFDKISTGGTWPKQTNRVLIGTHFSRRVGTIILGEYPPWNNLIFPGKHHQNGGSSSQLCLVSGSENLKTYNFLWTSQKWWVSTCLPFGCLFQVETDLELRILQGDHLVAKGVLEVGLPKTRGVNLGSPRYVAQSNPVILSSFWYAPKWFKMDHFEDFSWMLTL